MPGQIVKRGERTWLVRIYLGREPVSGKRIYRAKVIHGRKRDAEAYLAEALRRRDLAGTEAASRYTLVNELLDDLITDYRTKGQDWRWAERKVRLYLRPAFGNLRASRLTSELLQRYIAARREAGAAPATVNRELSLLRRAFNLGRAATPPKVAHVPVFPMLREDNARTGFLEAWEYRAIRDALPMPFKAILAFGYYTGCRQGEILALEWRQVDLIQGLARLEAAHTKTREPRTIPLAPELRAMLAILKAERDSGWPDCPWVFAEGGKPVDRNRLRWFWNAACRAAGFWHGGRPTKLFHDLRRTAVRNMIRAGVPERVAMTVSGHKTRSIFDRYNIVSEADLRQAAHRLAEYLEREDDRHTICTPAKPEPIH